MFSKKQPKTIEKARVLTKFLKLNRKYQITKMENKSAYFRNGSGECQRKVKYQLEK